MGGSPKRAMLMASSINRGRLVLLSVFGLQAALLVIYLIGAPRLLLLGSWPSPDSVPALQQRLEAEAGGEIESDSWLWRRFVVESTASPGNRTRLGVRWIAKDEYLRGPDVLSVGNLNRTHRNVSRSFWPSQDARAGAMVRVTKAPRNRSENGVADSGARQSHARVRIPDSAPTSKANGPGRISSRRSNSTQLRSRAESLGKGNDLRTHGQTRGYYVGVERQSVGTKQGAHIVGGLASNASTHIATVAKNTSHERVSEEEPGTSAITRSNVSSVSGKFVDAGPASPLISTAPSAGKPASQNASSQEPATAMAMDSRLHHGLLIHGHNASRSSITSLEASDQSLRANSTSLKLEQASILGSQSAAVNASQLHNASCLHGYIFVYTLPKKFNSELLENCSQLLQWGDRCRELANSGLGPSLAESPLRLKQRARHGGPWYGTDQFNGEVIFHNRLLAHPCRTHDPERAKAFYVPYYAGLDVARFLFNVTNKTFSRADRDRLGGELGQWLRRSPFWQRHQGLDHFLMLGRITWDFRRKGQRGWGSGFIHLPEMANVTKLALERDPWDATEMGVPYPTDFHPRNDSEVIDWQESLRKMRRDVLFSFAGGARKQFSTDFRVILLEQCRKAASCEAMDCSGRKCEDNSEATTRLFMRSKFCLQPRGDSFTRRSIFDSLVAGCIPVFFWPKSAYLQYHWYLPANYTTYSVFIPKDDIRGGVQIDDVLREIPLARIQTMQETILEMIPRLVYAGPEHELVKFKDAVDTTIDKVMAKFESARLLTTSAHTSRPVNLKHEAMPAHHQVILKPVLFSPGAPSDGRVRILEG